MINKITMLLEMSMISRWNVLRTAEWKTSFNVDVFNLLNEIKRMDA